MIREVVGVALVAGGVIFTVIGHIGLIRLPDFYTRAHAASKPDTIGVVLAMLGLGVLEGLATTTGVKLVLIGVLVAIVNPVGVHVLSRSALGRGIVPWRRR